MKSATSKSEPKKVVLLVDDRRRDLLVASLLAFQLRERGVECLLEPLEAYQGVLAAHRPDMMIFNHVTASHLVAYTQRLGKMNILTGVVLNEGLCYDEEERAFNAQKHHKGAHLDFFFCWNQPLKNSLHQAGFEGTQIEVVGNPRHDFYFPPWSEAFAGYPKPDNGKPLILLCTNFGLADFYDLPRSEVDKFFAPWKDRIPYLKDYMGIVEAHHRYREGVLKHLGALLASEKFNVILRPHPRERLDYYDSWISKLPEKQRELLEVDGETNITSLLMACDLAIGCENCNTTMEAWIAGKPAVELIFEKHPVLYTEEVAKLSPHCEDPAKLVGMVEEYLRNPAQKIYAEGRKAHLTKWCNNPSGHTTDRIADLIADAVKRKPASDFSQLTLTDHRRAMKLKLAQVVDEPYHYNPFQKLKAKLAGRHKTKLKAYNKAIRPSDVKKARKQLEDYYGKGKTKTGSKAKG
ncbi:MAG: surface carbohydrate biosynthesis protein [Verrucomicrobiota bacterium]